MGVLTLNGSDTADVLDISPTDLLDWWGSIERDIETVTPYGSEIAMRSAGHRTPAKPWPLRARLKKSAAADREAGLDALHRKLAETPSAVDSYRRAQEGEVSIEVSPSSRVAYAVCRGVQGGELPGQTPTTSGYTDLRFDWLFLDRAKYDAAASSEALVADTPEAIDVGTAPGWWMLEIDGGASVTDPEFIVYDGDPGGAGVELWRMSLTGSLAAGETWELDALRNLVIHDDGAGTRADVTDDVLPVAGDDTTFHLLAGGDLSSLWVELTVAGGTLNWRRRWAS